jgi:two-component system chemotaxis response regulator CheY
MSDQKLNLNGMIVSSQQNFLVLDDEGDINELIVDLLELIGFNGNFFQAYSIKDAKLVLQKQKIDYILSDWNLPDGQGISLLKALRKSPKFKNTPFLMITANNDVESMVLSSKTGGSEYLVKPFGVEDLEAKLIEGWKFHNVKEENQLEQMQAQITELKLEIDALRLENKKLKGEDN